MSMTYQNPRGCRLRLITPVSMPHYFVVHVHPDKAMYSHSFDYGLKNIIPSTRLDFRRAIIAHRRIRVIHYKVLRRLCDWNLHVL